MAELETQPDERGHWGDYGGRYVPETLMAPLEELTTAYLAAREDPAFDAELKALLHDYAGRPTPLFHAARLTRTLVAHKFCSSAKTCCIPAPTRLTIRWASGAGETHE